MYVMYVCMYIDPLILAIFAWIEQVIKNLLTIIYGLTFFGIPIKVDVLQNHCRYIIHILQYF